MKKQDENNNSSSVSFLDVIACAFGAIVLLLLILPIEKLGELADSNPTNVDYGQLVLNSQVLDAEIEALTQEVEENQALLNRLGSTATDEKARSSRYSNALATTTEELNRLRARIQSTEQALQTMTNRKVVSVTPKEYVGIPVDSEYVIFVIDTSGSMKNIWPKVTNEVNSVLSLYPEMKGFQVINDEGIYLYRTERKRWLPDSPQARSRAQTRLTNWKARSNSSPAKGIKTALNDLYDPRKKIALFLVGDDFSSQEDLDEYILDIERTVAAANVEEGSLRIHAIGFENHLSGVWSPMRFSILMRELSQRHDGAFLALPMYEGSVVTKRQIAQKASTSTP